MYNSPLLELVYAAAGVHRMHNDPSMVWASPRARRERAQGCAMRDDNFTLQGTPCAPCVQ